MKNTWNLFSKIALILLTSFIFCAMQSTVIQVCAQSKTVTGTIIDDTNFPLIGVSVVVRGSNTGTITDIDGNYSISVPGNNAILQYTFIGYVTQTVTVGSRTIINLTMKEDLQNLEEVVIVGYGVQKKSHLTGSISKLNTEGLEDLPITRVDQALQGKIAGVNIQNITSEAGVAPQIRVRGVGSISASSDPLVVVDGFPIADGLSFVEMSDIESIEVLKDAASAAIYGSRAANGVILVTTKSGKIDKPKYTFNTYHGIKSAYELNPIMKYSDYVRMLYRDKDELGGVDYVGNAEKAGYVLATQIIENEPNYQKEALRDFAQIHNYQLNISGGKQGTTYYLSTNYTSEEGIMKQNTYDKLSFRAKLESQLSKILKAGVNISPTYSQRERPSNNFTDFARYYSWVPVYHTEATANLVNTYSRGLYHVSPGDYAHPRHFSRWSGEAYYSPTSDPAIEYVLPDGTIFSPKVTDLITPWTSVNNNPVAILNGDTRKKNEYRMTANTYFTIDIAKGLQFKASQGAYVNYTENNEFAAYGAKREGEPSVGTYYNSLIVDLLSENTLTYDKLFNRVHSVNVMAGVTYQHVSNSLAGIQGTDYANDLVHTLNYANTFLKSGTYTDKLTHALASYLARANYSYQDKYLASLSIRTDGSSKFARGNRWSWFPSVSLGWRASEESFIKPVECLSNLKFRTSYGVTGNNAIEDYAYTNPLYSAVYATGSGNGSLVPGLATGNILGNSDLSWERTNEFNAGFDMGLIDNRISIIFDYYYSITDQLLFRQPALAYSGYSSFWNNIGKVRNRGIEIELNTINIATKKFKWETKINFSANRNRLLEIGGEAAQYYTGERNEVYAAVVGGPSIQFFGYKTDGVWSQADVDALGFGDAGQEKKNKMKAKPGALKVVDTNKDGKITAEDRVLLGANPFPDFTWGMTNTLTYKNVEFSFMFQGVQGIDIINGDAYYTENKRINENYAKNKWISDAYPGDGKTPNGRAGGMDWMLTDYVIEDGSYIALRDVSLSYKLPSKVAKKVSLRGLRVYGTVQNLLYIMASNYKGINPEYKYTNGEYGSPFIDGYQRGAFPLQRTYTLGLSVTF